MRHPHNPRLPLPHNPTHFHQPREHRRSQRSRQMWLPLRPIQTPPRKRPSPSTNSCDINANPPKKFFAIPPQLILPFAASANSPRSLHSPCQLHRNNSRQMVVARPRHPNIRIRHTRSAAITIRPSHRQRTGRFQRVRHIRIRQFVIPVPPLTPHRQQSSRGQLRQMPARRLRRNIPRKREFARRPRPAIQQRHENRRPRPVAKQFAHRSYAMHRARRR